MQPRYWQEACVQLADRDPVLAGITRAYRGETLRSRGEAFTTLARSIVGQQISVKAADAIWARLAAACDIGAPAAVRAIGPESLRGCGLSGRKAEYLSDLAQRFLDGSLDPRGWHALDDESLIRELTQVKGIGRWTAEMFLIFYLLRPDVLPLDDLGLQRAVSVHYARGRPVSRARLTRIARAWSPWRSVATWYLWRSLDPVPVEY